MTSVFNAVKRVARLEGEEPEVEVITLDEARQMMYEELRRVKPSVGFNLCTAAYDFNPTPPPGKGFVLEFAERPIGDFYRGVIDSLSLRSQHGLSCDTSFARRVAHACSAYAMRDLHGARAYERFWDPQAMEEFTILELHVIVHGLSALATEALSEATELELSVTEDLIKQRRESARLSLEEKLRPGELLKERWQHEEEMRDQAYKALGALASLISLAPQALKARAANSVLFPEFEREEIPKLMRGERIDSSDLLKDLLLEIERQSKRLKELKSEREKRFRSANSFRF